MKRYPLSVLCVLAGGCLFIGCTTRIENGAFKFSTPANAKHMYLSGPGVVWDAEGLNHATPTRAAFTGASHLVASAGTAALPFVTGVPVAARIAPIVPATIPVFRATPDLRP